MPDSDDPKAEASAQKAYAAAAEATPGESAAPKPESAPVADVAAAPTELPVASKRVAKAKPSVPAVVAAVEPVKPRGVRSATAGKPPIQRAAKPASAPARALAVQPKALPVKPKPLPVYNTKTASKAATAVPTAVPAGGPRAAPIRPTPLRKEPTMDINTSIKDAVSGAQDKAKEAFSKSSAFASEYTGFAKGNVEALVESGKILASGLQDLGKKMLDDSKSVLEATTTDVKTLAGVKSPTDFFKLQSDIVRRNFETAIALSTKTGEAMVKLTSDTIAPLSARVNLAVEKVKTAA